MKSHHLKTALATAALLTMVGCVDVGEVKDAANEVIDNAAQAAADANNGGSGSNGSSEDDGASGNSGNSGNSTLTWAESEEQFWTQPLSEILLQVKAAVALEETVSTCGDGTEAPRFYSVTYTDADANHGTSSVSRDAAQMLSCHMEWQSRYVARLFPEYTAWLQFAADATNSQYSPFLHSRISQGPAETDISGVTDICSNARDDFYTNYDCYYPDWTDGLAPVDLYPHAQWARSQFYEHYQFQYGALNLQLLWNEDNWKSTLRHYFAEEGTRDIRSLALHGLATKKPTNTDANGNYIPWIVNSFHSASLADSQRQVDAFTAQDTVIYKIGLHQGW